MIFKVKYVIRLLLLYVKIDKNIKFYVYFFLF